MICFLAKKKEMIEKILKKKSIEDNKMEPFNENISATQMNKRKITF